MGQGMGQRISLKIRPNYFTHKIKEKFRKPGGFRNFYGCGGRTRTYDLRVMSCKKRYFPLRVKDFYRLFAENPEVMNPLKCKRQF